MLLFLKLGACLWRLLARDYSVGYNFLYRSAIFGLVTGLQHAVFKQIIKQVFSVVRPPFQYSIKWGERRRSRWSHGAGILFAWITKYRRRGKTNGLHVSSTKGRPKLACRRLKAYVSSATGPHSPNNSAGRFLCKCVKSVKYLTASVFCFFSLRFEIVVLL